MAKKNPSLEERESAIATLVSKYNEVAIAGKYKQMHDIEEDIGEQVNEYTSVVRMQALKRCAEADDPMYEAIVNGSFVTLYARPSKEGELKIPTLTLEKRSRKVNLIDLHSHCKGIGKDHNWYYMVQRLNMALTAKKTEQLGRADRLAEVNDSYAIAKLAKSISLGEDPVSDENLIATIKGVVAAMVGEEYAKGVDKETVVFLVDSQTKKSTKRACTLACANHSALVAAMADVCLHCIKGVKYDTEWKAKKQD